MSKAFRGERLHIAVFGRCNTGKSTILNLIAGQKAAIVSPQPGTTGDPVGLPFELPPLGAVTLYDTAGLDEASPLGALRREAGRKILARADLAVLVTDEQGIGRWEEEVGSSLQALMTPFLVVFNKKDIQPARQKDRDWCTRQGIPFVEIAACQSRDPAALRQMLVQLAPEPGIAPPLVVDLLPPGGMVLCVTPIDASAPKGRLIAPQVQTLRELVEHHHPAMVAQPTELAHTLELLREPPALIVTDSQVVQRVVATVPQDLPLTTFSVLFARLKGDFDLLLAGTKAMDSLGHTASVLIAEACSHHPQEDDIARVKLPALLRRRLGPEIAVSLCSGSDFPDDLSPYDLVIHCGGCMLTPREQRRRLKLCAASGTAVSNFGMTISLIQGVLERVTAPLIDTRKNGA